MINKLARKIVTIIGILCLVTVLTVNVVVVARVSDSIAENVSIQVYGVLNFLMTSLIAIGLLCVSKKIDKIKWSPKIKIGIFIVFILLYIVGQIYWIQTRQAGPVYDQRYVYSDAINMYENKWEQIKHSSYLQLYPQQLTLATVYVGLFKLFGTTSVKLLQYGNVIANALTVIALLLITKQLGKQYKVSMGKTLVLIATFFTLPLLSVFVYGDIMSIPMCLLASYFIMKYGMEKKIRYAILSAIFMSVAYMLRMNNLIYIIALFIYLLLELFSLKEKNIKLILQKIGIIIVFLVIAVLPTNFTKSSLQAKLELEPNKQYPTEGFLYMGMEEGSRANGWYNEYAEWAFADAEASKEQYKNAIEKRIQHFSQNPKYFVEFYAKKIASMWAENTYQSLWYNQSYNIQQTEEEVDEMQVLRIDAQVRRATERLLIFQKAIIWIIFGSSILVMIKYRNKLSNEMILLITIFIGGFLFHTLWEAKSRYIISYIVALIPLASIILGEWDEEKNWFLKVKEKVKISVNKKN